jgi:hypothetical protein
VNAREHLLADAERELCSFMRAVSKLFGAEHARRAADHWLDEFERIDALPESPRSLRAITIVAAARLTASLGDGRRRVSRAQ